MQRFSGTNAVTIGTGRTGFANRNLGATPPVLGSVPNADWMNGVQESMAGLVEATGLTMADGVDNAAIQSMRRLAGGNVNYYSASATLGADNAGLVVANTTGGSITLILPAAAAAAGNFQGTATNTPVRLSIVRADGSTNTLTLQCHGAEAFNGGGTSYPVMPCEAVTLVSDGGGGWFVVASTAAGRRRQVFQSSGTFTPMPGLWTYNVIVTGGGAGGMDSASSTVDAGYYSGPGGGAGGTAIGRLTTGGGTAPIAITIGAGGAAQYAGGASGFGAFMIATGGQPGGYSLGGYAGFGGAPGVGYGGDIQISGGWGGDGMPNGVTQPGYGGASFWGGGGRSGDGIGMAGTAFGAGGGGAQHSASGTGGAGAPGIVVVEW